MADDGRLSRRREGIRRLPRATTYVQAKSNLVRGQSFGRDQGRRRRGITMRRENRKGIRILG